MSFVYIKWLSLIIELVLFCFFNWIATLWFELCLRVINVKCSGVNIQQVMCNGGIIDVNMQNDGIFNSCYIYNFFSCLPMICMNKSFRHLHWPAFIFQHPLLLDTSDPLSWVCNDARQVNLSLKVSIKLSRQKIFFNSWWFIKSSKVCWRKLHFLPHHSGHLNSNNYVWKCCPICAKLVLFWQKSQSI